MKLLVKNKHLKQYEEGSPLITKESLMNFNKLKVEGCTIELYSEADKFLGKGYFGIQNKGYGWILSKDIKTEFDQAFFQEKIYNALLSREDLYKDDKTNAFRVFNNEGDAVGGLAIDYFDGYYVITFYSIGIYEYKDMILQALKEATAKLSAVDATIKGVYEKKRFNEQGKYIDDNDFVYGDEASKPLIVLENNVKFAVYLNDGPMVGIFLDQREVRQKIKEKYSEGKTVLNMFSYTGAFSVYAALGGAQKTTSVDLANRSRAKTREQFEVNDIDPDTQEIIVEDVFNYFKYAAKKERTFDLVILDPPSFSRSKKRVFSASKDYVDLLKDAIKLTNENGVIIASTNYSNMDMDKFQQFVRIAFKESTLNYQILETFTLPSDFKSCNERKESDYLKVVIIKRVDR